MIRSSKMSRYDHSDIPDFLQDSPFLPVGSHNDAFSKPPPPVPRPTIRQILKSKRVRRDVACGILLILSFLLLRRIHSFVITRWFSGPRCLVNPPIIPPTTYPVEGIDWSRFAYAQYATNANYLCSAVMLFETLHKLGSKADRLLLFPKTFRGSSVSRLLEKAHKEYNVKVVHIDTIHKKNAYYFWADSMTKLTVFNQTQYGRILYLDSDSTILNHMDELFFMPSHPVILSRAYWQDFPQLTSHIMLLEPSTQSSSRLSNAISKASPETYDMEIVNRVFGSSCLVLPHRKYALLTGEFRYPAKSPEHERYMGQEKWDAVEIYKEAKFVHFSDDPFPKPWIEASDSLVQRYKPVCSVDEAGDYDCRAREIWLGLYEDFQERRMSVCGIARGQGV